MHLYLYYYAVSFSLLRRPSKHWPFTCSPKILRAQKGFYYMVLLQVYHGPELALSCNVSSSSLVSDMCCSPVHTRSLLRWPHWDLLEGHLAIPNWKKLYDEKKKDIVVWESPVNVSKQVLLLLPCTDSPPFCFYMWTSGRNNRHKCFVSLDNAVIILADMLYFFVVAFAALFAWEADCWMWHFFGAERSTPFPHTSFLTKYYKYLNFICYQPHLHLDRKMSFGYSISPALFWPKVWRKFKHEHMSHHARNPLR